MKKIIYLTAFLFFGLSSSINSQETIIEELCVNLNQIDPNGYDIFSNDLPFQQGLQPLLPPEGPCYFFANGLLYLNADEMCCDSIQFFYAYPESHDKYLVNIVIKCDTPEPKPNCTNIYLSPPDLSSPGGDPTQGDKPTYFACDSTPVTYYIDNPGTQTVIWDTGVVPHTQISNSEISIEWPGPNTYTITVTIGTESTIYCIEVLQSPTADFNFAGTCGCKNTEIGFMSTGTGGNHFYWDFGDGMIEEGEIVNHEYTTAGTYDVTLVVVQDNFDGDMNPLCCCSDTIIKQIEILDLEGPDIYWISTLCEGDSTKYWTDAVGCTYAWTAVDANGMNVLPSGTVTTNDTLCVPWGDGPFGEVGLTVTGCTNTTYCPKPSTAIVPIIEDESTIEGKDTVCFPSFEFYSVPKWPTVTYNWDISPIGAATFTGQGTNAISVNWNGNFSSATITVNYTSDFLGGIVGHEPNDCSGFAELDVAILPRFELSEPEGSKFCIDENIDFEAGPVAPSTVFPAFFNWVVNPPVGPTYTTTLSGTSTYTTSFSDPGYYTISVYPSSPNPYCNDTIVKRIEIVSVPDMLGIDGPKEVCEGDTATYFGLSGILGTEFHWIATGGSIYGSNIANPVKVIWNTAGPYTISAYQQQINAPNCPSDTIDCPVDRKTLGTGYSINGPSACINEIMTYSISPIPSDPDVNYNWVIMSSLNGSVVSGDTGPVVDIQWNNTLGVDTIYCTLTLCGDTLQISRIVNLSEAAPVAITQNSPYCIGAIGVNLTASTSGSTYSWTTPPPSPAVLNAQSVIVTAPGNYVVTVTETNGCSAIANYEVFENGLPNVNLTSPNNLGLCIQDAGSTVDLHALVGSYSYQWYKSANGGLYNLTPETSPILTHTNSGVIGYCQYYYIATDLTSGCSNQSNNLLVTQDSCVIDTLCIPEAYSTFVTSSPALPECNKINFSTSNSLNVNITGWNFNDPSLNNAYIGSITAPTYTYTYPGYYTAVMFGTVPNQDNTALCTVSDTNLVCIPLVADFDYTYDCGEYTFTSTSAWISGAAPDTLLWDFGDGGTGIGGSVMHTYNVTVPTSFTITLTISNPDDCIAIYTESIIVYPPPIADIIAMPADTCVDKPFMFSNVNNAGLIGWDWEFGDMSTNGSPNPKHSYDIDGTYMVTLTVTDENGCTNTDTETVIVHPSAITGPITYADDLFLCFGQSLVLNAPAGDQYIWSTGATTASITVSIQDTYGVTVTDINGCTFIPDSVDVVVYPEVDATISGSTVICDEGCTTLYAVSAAGYSYQWEDDFGPITTMPSVEICYDALNTITFVNLTVSDANSCTAVESVLIDYFPSPDVLITPSNPTLCEGTLNTLTASTTFPGPVVFDWSTGASGPSIDVLLEGTYRVTVTDTISGCAKDTFINVNPLPDLCIVPYGCYTACDPDTICAPPDLVAYEWYYNGVLQPIYSGMECIIVTQSGAYNFAGTNEYNCEAFSDTLYLEMIPCCRPGDTDISAFVPVGQEDCCYSFNYSLNQDIFYALDLHSNDADLALNLGSVNPLLGVSSSLPTINSFEGVPSNNPLPQGPLSGFATICLENTTSNPVEIIADWRGVDGEILCSDTLYLECLVEPDCIYVQNDSIYCDSDGNLQYEVTICNPIDAAYSIAYIDFLELTPAGVMLNPSAIDLGGNPLLPGDCLTQTLSLIGSGLANQTLCYNLVGHQYDPNENPGALCCSVDTTYCIFIPGCSPCEMIYVSGIDSSSMGECCYDVTVNNYLQGGSFTGINLCVLSPGATFDIFNPLTSPWDVSSLTTTTANLDYNDGTNTTIPLGDTSLPTICVGDNEIAFVDVEIKWMSGPDVECRDTISLLCPGDCGYMTETSLVCGPNGTWVFTGFITNTSQDTMDTAYIDFGQDLLNAYDTEINLNGLLPDHTFGPFSIVLSGTTGVGPELCIITTLHANDHNDDHEDCCQFKTVIDVPNCEDPVDCICGPDFEEQVNQGISCDLISPPFTYEFSPNGNFGYCDDVVWDFKKQQISYNTTGNEVVTHTFPSNGEFTVCMTIVRTQPNGKQCKEKFCKDVVVGENGLVSAFPNPVTNQINLVLKGTSFDGWASIEIMDSNNRKCRSMQLEMSDQTISSIDVTDLKTGVYMMRINMDNKIHTKRILIVR